MKGVCSKSVTVKSKEGLELSWLGWDGVRVVSEGFFLSLLIWGREALWRSVVTESLGVMLWLLFAGTRCEGSKSALFIIDGPVSRPVASCLIAVRILPLSLPNVLLSGDLLPLSVAEGK